MRRTAAIVALIAAGCSGEDPAAAPVPQPPPAATDDPIPGAREPESPEPEEPPATQQVAPSPWPHATERTLDVRVTGDEFRWLIVYPGPDGVLDTPDDLHTMRHLHLPADSEVTVELHSADYVYTFYVPTLDLMENAVPGSPFRFGLDTGSAAPHDLLGSQMCGYTHPELIGDVVVHPPADFSDWLAGLPGGG